jgi:hypothetical protein
VDADDFRVNGENASDFSNLVDNGLVRVTMPLPVNVRLVDPVTGLPSNETSVDLWRAVMPVLNVVITGLDDVLPIWPPGAPRVPSWVRTPTVRIGKVVINVMRGLPHYKSRRRADCSRRR